MDGHRRSNQGIDHPRPEIINSSIMLRLILATMKRLCSISSAQWFIIEMEPSLQVAYWTWPTTKRGGAARVLNLRGGKGKLNIGDGNHQRVSTHARAAYFIGVHVLAPQDGLILCRDWHQSLT
ncbi:hypothetical protein G6F66_000785 [Rhizopus arrhizus]|nr:hypothetical protein G6F66_000785 [Rhizopus arrhizus]